MSLGSRFAHREGRSEEGGGCRLQGLSIRSWLCDRFSESRPLHLGRWQRRRRPFFPLPAAVLYCLDLPLFRYFLVCLSHQEDAGSPKAEAVVSRARSYTTSARRGFIHAYWMKGIKKASFFLLALHKKCFGKSRVNREGRIVSG